MDLLKAGCFETIAGPREDAGIRPSFEGVVAGRVVEPSLIRAAGSGVGVHLFESVELHKGVGRERGPPQGIGLKEIITGRVVQFGHICTASSGMGIDIVKPKGVQRETAAREREFVTPSDGMVVAGGIVEISCVRAAIDGVARGRLGAGDRHVQASASH